MGCFLNKSNTEIKKKTFTIVLLCLLVMIVLVGRLINIMVFKSDYYQKRLMICMKEKEISRQPEVKY